MGADDRGFAGVRFGECEKMSTSFEIFPASKKKIDCAKIMEYSAVLLREFKNQYYDTLSA